MKDFLPSVGKSFLIIFLSEIADRTFILILIYTSKISWFPLLITSILALGFMNVIAVSIGYLLPLLLLKEVVDWIGFACFTVKCRNIFFFSTRLMTRPFLPMLPMSA